jgi:hypothetical protein
MAFVTNRYDYKSLDLLVWLMERKVLMYCSADVTRMISKNREN